MTMNLLQLDAIGRSDPQNARLRRGYKRKNQKIPAILGKGDKGDPFKNAGNNRIWIRRDGSADADNNIGTTLPEAIYCGSGSYPVYDGAKVWIETDPNGQWQVAGPNNADADGAKIHLGQSNALNPTNNWIRLKNATRLKALPVGTAANPSTLVGIRGATFVDDYGDFNQFTATGLVADMFDLSPYIPGSGLHAVVVLWLDTVNNSIVATSSTAQSTSTALDATDYQEAMSGQPADGIALQAFHIGDGQTSVDQRDLGDDLRPFLNMPTGLGFPSPLDKDQIIRSGRFERVCDDITVTANMVVAGEFVAESITTTGSGSITISGSGSLTTQSCDVNAIGDEIDGITPLLVEIDNTNSPYTATTEAIDITIACDTTAGDITVNLPAIATNKNQRYGIINVGTGTVTIDGNASETIIGNTTLTIPFQYDAPRLIATSTEWLLT